MSIPTSWGAEHQSAALPHHLNLPKNTIPSPELPVGTPRQELAAYGPSPSQTTTPQILYEHLPLSGLWHCQAEVIIWAKWQELDQNPTSIVLLGR